MDKSREYVWKDRRHILWFPWTFDKYGIANGKLYTEKGFLSTVESELLIYRVLDISLKRTLMNRICGTGTIVLKTRDASDMLLELRNIKDSKRVKDFISDLVEKEKEAKRVVGKEMYGSNPTDMSFDEVIEETEE